MDYIQENVISKMSRVIVKNLPKFFNEENFKTHFSKKYPGEITDVKIMKSRTGESRRFGFLGFKTIETAVAAVKYFDNSFINTSKIQVELAKTFSDPDVPKPVKQMIWESKERLRNQEEEIKRKVEEEEEASKRKKQKRSNGAIGEEINKELENNPKLKEFLEATKNSAKVSSWDDGIIGTIDKDKKELLKIKENESDEEYEAFNNDKEEKMISLENFGKEESKSEDVEMEQQEQEKEIDDDNSKNASDSNVSDLDWLKQRQKRIKDGESLIEEPKNIESKEEKQPELLQEPAEPKETVEDQILKTGRLFIRNISYAAAEEEFIKLFKKFGKLDEVHIATDKKTNKSKGFVYVQFKYPKDAVNAYHKLDKQIFQGRLLHILPGQGKKSHKLDEFDMKNLPLKKQKELKRRFEASKETFSWNSLFLNENTVLETIAQKIGVDKRDLLDPESSNSGVQQALAEAHVIKDVRGYFEKKGIDLVNFNDKKEKDDKIILVKNLPFNTTLDEIMELFAKYGNLNRILFPPIGTIAIVEFKDSPSGRSAFSKLAYRRFKKNIIYLEKGPKDLLKNVEETVNDTNKFDTTNKENNPNVKEAKISIDDLVDTKANGDEEEEGEETFEGITTSVFIKNLNFKTTSKDLQDIFKPLEGYIIAKVSTKADAKNPGKVLSMGFGFVEFQTKENADSCIKILNGKVIDDHKIELKLSHRKNEVNNSSTSKAKVPKGEKSTKLIVKNLPFEVVRNDIFKLFQPFGQIKSVRLPKKFNKSARGFAFVEYNLLKEAETAIDSLTGVHLLGRRLNISYANNTEDNEQEISKMINKMQKQKNLIDYAKASKLNGKKRVEMEDENDDLDGF